MRRERCALPPACISIRMRSLRARCARSSRSKCVAIATLLPGASFSSLFDMQGSPLPVSFQSGLYQLYRLCLLYRCVTRCIKGRLSFPNLSLEYALGSGGLDLSLRDRSRAAHEEPDDIDEQGGDGQHAEQQRLREGNPKKRIQRIASRSHESDSQARGEQLERKLQTMIPVPETVLPMGLDNRHEHCAYGPCCSQGCQEPKRQGKAASELTEDHQTGPKPGRVESLFLHPLYRLSEPRTSKPAKPLRSLDGQCQSGYQAEKK